MGTVIQEPGLNSVEGEVRPGFRNVDHGVCTEMEDLVGGGAVFFLVVLLYKDCVHVR